MQKRNSPCQNLKLLLFIILLTDLQTVYTQTLPKITKSLYDQPEVIWNQTLVHHNQDILFLRGTKIQDKGSQQSTTSNINIDQKQDISARYCISQVSYDWIRIFTNKNGQIAQIQGFSLDLNNESLVFVGNFDNILDIFIWFADPTTGNLQTSQKLPSLSQKPKKVSSLLFTDTSKLYLSVLTAQNSLEILVLDLQSGEVNIFQDNSPNKFETQTQLLQMSQNQKDLILIGASHLIYEDQFRFSLLTLNAENTNLIQNDIFLTKEWQRSFINKMIKDIENQRIFFTTYSIDRKFTSVCQVAFKNSDYTTLVLKPVCMKCYDSSIILDLIQDGNVVYGLTQKGQDTVQWSLNSNFHSFKMRNVNKKINALFSQNIGLVLIRNLSETQFELNDDNFFQNQTLKHNQLTFVLNKAKGLTSQNDLEGENVNGVNTIQNVVIITEQDNVVVISLSQIQITPKKKKQDRILQTGNQFVFSLPNYTYYNYSTSNSSGGGTGNFTVKLQNQNNVPISSQLAIITQTTTSSNGSDTSFISLNQATYINDAWILNVTWSQAGSRSDVYNITIQIQLNSGNSSSTGIITFGLNVIGASYLNCITSPNSTITWTGNMSNLFYPLPQPNQSKSWQNVSIVQSSESYCNGSDVTYSNYSVPSGHLTINNLTNISWVFNNCLAINSTIRRLATLVTNIKNYTHQDHFNVTEVCNCFQSSNQINITQSQVPEQIYMVNQAMASVTFNINLNFSEVCACCQLSDIISSITITPLASFVQVNGSQVSWNTSDNTQCGNYTITLTSTLNRTLSNIVTNTSSFNLVIVPTNCTMSHDSFNLNSNSMSSQIYRVADPQASLDLTTMTPNYSQNCTSQDVVYDPILINSTNLVSTNSTPTVSWYTTNNSHAGVYNITRKGKIIRIPSTYSVIFTQYFILTIQYLYCNESQDTLIINSTQIFVDQTYKITNLTNTFSFTTTNAQSLYCNNSDIFYSPITISPNAPFTSVSGINGSSISWQTNNNSYAGNYTISRVSTITRALGYTVTNTQSFILTLTAPICNESMDTLILNSTADVNQIYIVSYNQTSYDFLPINATSTYNYCNNSDIVYSPITISPNAPFTSVSGINGSSISWQTNNNSYAGNYTISRVSTITRALGYTVSYTQTFILTVIQMNCTNSTDPLIITSQAIIDQTYPITNPEVSFDFPQMNVSSNYCSQQDIDYQINVSPQDFFINKSIGGQNLIWFTNNISHIGNYTITRTGTVTRNADLNTTNQSFILIVSYSACNLSQMSSNSAQYLNYNVLDPQVTLSFTEVNANSTICFSQDNFTSTITIYPDASFITVKGKSVSWYTNDISKAGNYTIISKQVITSSSGSVIQTDQILLNVVFKPVNHVPIFDGLTSDKVTIFLSQHQGPTFLTQLGKIFDQDQDDTVTISFYCNPTYFSIQQGYNLVVNYDALMKLGSHDSEVTVNCQIALQDSNTQLPGIHSYELLYVIPIHEEVTNKVQNDNQIIITEQISQANVNGTQKQEVKIKFKNHPQPTWKSIQITDQGTVKIQFSELLAIPGNFTNMNASVLQVNLIKGGYDQTQNKSGYKWNVTIFKNDYFVIQIDFENPLLQCLINQTIFIVGVQINS